MNGVDTETFSFIGDVFSKDKNYVYAMGERVKGADPQTFVVIDGVAQDKYCGPYSMWGACSEMKK